MTTRGESEGESEDELLAALARTDARLDAALARRGAARLTLAPERATARSLEALGRDLFARARPVPGLAEVLGEGLARTAEAILEHFPDNLFWDLDALGAGLLREALRAKGHDAARAHLAGAFDEVLALHALFGRSTPIRFRYVHDFALGFDWAKWVRRAPSARVGIGPFDRAFLRSMLARGGELLELIAADDAKYHRLDGEGARNPFGFSREPADELRLHRDLAARRLIPVRAWELDAEPVWDRPYQAEREARASALHIAAS